MSSLSADFLTPFRKSARSVLILDPAQPESPPAFYANRNGPAHSIQPSPLSADSLWSSPKSQTLPAYRRIGAIWMGSHSTEGSALVSERLQRHQQADLGLKVIVRRHNIIEEDL